MRRLRVLALLASLVATPGLLLAGCTQSETEVETDVETPAEEAMETPDTTAAGDEMAGDEMAGDEESHDGGH